MSSKFSYLNISITEALLINFNENTTRKVKRAFNGL